MARDSGYNRGKAIASMTPLEMVIINELLDFTGAKPEDTIIDIDTHKFYEHCYEKFFKEVIDRNVDALGVDRHFMTYSMQIKFLGVINNVSIYDVERIRLLQMTKEFIQDYEDYLNDKDKAGVQ